MRLAMDFKRSRGDAHGGAANRRAATRVEEPRGKEHPESRGRRFGAFQCLVVLVALGGIAAAEVDWRLKHGVIWYSRARDDTVRQQAAQRYGVGITGKGDGEDADRVAIKTLNPGFRWYVYNSGTDNYVTSRQGTAEHDLLQSLAASTGTDVEEAYLHYWDDTRVVLEGETLLVRGWGGGTAANGAEARLPVYYRNLSRRAVNFSTPRALRLHREVMVHLAFDTPFAGSNLYPEGIFLDNATAQFFNFGNILSGGRVREAPGHPVVGSREHGQWHWSHNLGPFLSALKDTLDAATAWAADGRRKELMINVANIWDDDYVRRDVAHVLFMEFQYNPVRNFGIDLVDEAYRRNSLAEAAGIATFHSAMMARNVQNRQGEYSFGEAMLGNLAFYLIARTPRTLFYEMGTNAPNVAAWDTLTWRGCIDVASAQLGTPTGAPYTLLSGADPMGNAYAVKARRYERGLVVLRNRGDWNQGIEAETAVAVKLPAPLVPVDPNGKIGLAVQEIRLRNGQGAILLGDPGRP